ncbi:MAG: hypothetical protein CM15mP46_2900 [Alphaproteobacteria bacterium]|nr:MAG: hypothetical protein CM15mP46_2900 [Alphaproteobacteria bacterium]
MAVGTYCGAGEGQILMRWHQGGPGQSDDTPHPPKNPCRPGTDLAEKPANQPTKRPTKPLVKTETSPQKHRFFCTPLGRRIAADRGIPFIPRKWAQVWGFKGDVEAAPAHNPAAPASVSVQMWGFRGPGIGVNARCEKHSSRLKI